MNVNRRWDSIIRFAGCESNCTFDLKKRKKWMLEFNNNLMEYLYFVTADLHAWVVIFILPVNSAVNPLLYTFTTPKFREKLHDEWFRKMHNCVTRKSSQGISL